MSFVAGEMQREGFTIPLMIGGATTSRVHTAVKIEPNYKGPTVHVIDASRAVGVAGNLRSGTRKAQERHQSIADARKNRLPVEWSGLTPPRPCFTGVRVLDDYPLEEL